MASRRQTAFETASEMMPTAFGELKCSFFSRARSEGSVYRLVAHIRQKTPSEARPYVLVLSQPIELEFVR